MSELKNEILREFREIFLIQDGAVKRVSQDPRTPAEIDLFLSSIIERVSQAEREAMVDILNDFLCDPAPIEGLTQTAINHETIKELCRRTADTRRRAVVQDILARLNERDRGSCAE